MNWFNRIWQRIARRKDDDFMQWLMRQQRLMSDMDKNNLSPSMKARILFSDENAPPKSKRTMFQNLRRLRSESMLKAKALYMRSKKDNKQAEKHNNQSPSGYDSSTRTRTLSTIHDTFKIILENDTTSAKDPIDVAGKNLRLPDWFDSTTNAPHLWLKQALARENTAKLSNNSTRIANATFETTIVFEFVIASGLGIASQQIADAWFHKAVNYVWLADQCDGTIEEHEQSQFIIAARHCIKKAMSKPQYIQPVYTRMKQAIMMRSPPYRRGSQIN